MTLGEIRVYPHLRFLGIPLTDGTHANYATIYEDFVCTLLDALSEEVAIFMELFFVGL